MKGIGTVLWTIEESLVEKLRDDEARLRHCCYCAIFREVSRATLMHQSHSSAMLTEDEQSIALD